MGRVRAPHRRRALLRRASFFGLLLFLFSGFATPSALAMEAFDFSEVDLVEFSKVQVISASRRATFQNHTAAAVSVLSHQELRRSGAQNLPEALRLVPGTDVGQLNAAIWSVGIRGYGGENANQLLVMVDNRSLYFPILAGTLWEFNEVPLAEVERLEVVRGPGATAWGSNAVSGVVHVVTKTAAETQGSFLELTSGSETPYSVYARQGLALSERAHLRIYGKAARFDESRLLNGEGAGDAGHSTRAGVRCDWEPQTTTAFTFSGEFVEFALNQQSSLPSLTHPGGTLLVAETQRRRGGFLSSSFRHNSFSDYEYDLRASFDWVDSDNLYLRNDLWNLDLDSQVSLPFGSHFVTAGLGLRSEHDQNDNSGLVKLYPARSSLEHFSAFVFDEINLVPKLWKLELGLRTEYQDQLGWLHQPTLRCLFTPHRALSFWASTSRALRRPNRVDLGASFDSAVLPAGTLGPLPALLRILGDAGLEPVTLQAFEVGGRWQASRALSFDLVFFLHSYDDVIFGNLDPSKAFVEGSPSPPHLVIPAIFGSNRKDLASGAELAVSWQPLRGWRLFATYSYLDVDADLTPARIALERNEGDTPRHRCSLRSSADWGSRGSFDLTLFRVGERAYYQIPGYTELELRLAWKCTKEIELALLGKNLLHRQHQELQPVNPVMSGRAVERSVTAQLTCRF